MVSLETSLTCLHRVEINMNTFYLLRKLKSKIDLPKPSSNHQSNYTKVVLLK